MFWPVYRKVILTATVSNKKNVHEQLKLDITVSLNLTIFDLTTPSDVSSASVKRTQIWTDSDFAVSTTVFSHLDSDFCVESALNFSSIIGLISRDSKSAYYCSSTTAISLLMSSKNYTFQTTDRLIPSTRASSAEFTRWISSHRDSWSSIEVILVILENVIFLNNLLLLISWLQELS